MLTSNADVPGVITENADGAANDTVTTPADQAGPELTEPAVAGEEKKNSEIKLFRSQVPNGYLFPAPFDSHKDSQRQIVLNRFKLLGQLVGKALIDSRIVDLPLHPLFWRLVKSTEHIPTCFSHNALASVDPGLFAQLNGLKKMNAADLEATCLDFTLPGLETYLLVDGGDSRSVTPENVQEYIDLVTEHTLYTSIKEQVKAFRQAFLSLHAMESITMWSERELSHLVVGSSTRQNEFWSKAHLERYIVPSGGYTGNSQVFVNLIEVMAELTLEQRKNFLSFVTGAHCLPPNGFQGLKPPLYVVKKEESNPDGFLPSVMTCANYFKLPQYSTKEILREKLFHAINGDGLHSFLLS